VEVNQAHEPHLGSQSRNSDHSLQENLKVAPKDHNGVRYESAQLYTTSHNLSSSSEGYKNQQKKAVQTSLLLPTHHQMVYILLV